MGRDMAGYLTTHVLDTSRGCPAQGLKIELFAIDDDSNDDGRTHLRTLWTNQDGRTDEPILPEAEFAIGDYELVFHAGPYLDAAEIPSGTPPETPSKPPRFLSTIPIRFGMSEARHYHVPLLISSFGYSTYRGS